MVYSGRDEMVMDFCACQFKHLSNESIVSVLRQKLPVSYLSIFLKENISTLGSVGIGSK